MGEKTKQAWTIGMEDEQALMLVALANIWRSGGAGWVLDVADKKYYDKIGTYQRFDCCGVEMTGNHMGEKCT